MSKVFKALAGDTIIYGLSSVVSAAIGFFLIPIYTSVFSPADYGVISLINTTQALIAIFVTFGLDNSVATWYYSHPSEVDRSKSFTSWLIFSLSMGIVIALVLYFGSKSISAVLLGDEKYFGLLQIQALTVVCASISKIPIILFRFQRKPLLAVAQAVSLSLVTVVFSILFVLKMQMGIRGAVLSQALAGLISVLFVIGVMKNRLDLKNFSPELLKDMLRFSLPLVPMALLMWGQGSAMSYLLNIYLPKYEIGLYQLAVSCSGIISMVTFAFFQAWTPFALSIRKNENSSQIYVNVFHCYAVAAAICTLLVSLVAKPFFGLIANEKYFAAAPLLGLLCLNVFLSGVPQVLSIVNSFAKNNTSLLKSYLISSVVTVASFFIYIRFFQKESAVYAMLTGNFALVIYNYYSSQKLHYFPYSKMIVFFCFLVALLVAVLMHSIF